MPNLFESMIDGFMMEAPGDDQGGQQPAAADNNNNNQQAADANAPPEIGDLSMPDMGAGGGIGGAGDQMGMDGMGMDQTQGMNAQEEDPNALPLDEKGEIFAKVKLLKSYQQMHQKVKDTIETIDKIDLVQLGNNIKNDDINEIKGKVAELLEDIYTTIVYEFQLAYGNLKVKLVEFTSRYVVLMKDLKRLILKDQANAES